MASSNSTIRVAITGEASGLKRAFGQASKDAEGFGSKAKTVAGGLGKLFLGGGVVAAGVGALGKSFYDAAIESQKVAKQTEAVIKSTGGAANVTAADVDKLTTALSMKSGIDDELIASGQNVLLTFTNIRNEAGKGNDIFNQASATALDMSVALGTDLKGANIQLGKALNDPIKGITALSRVGVSFTEDQKKQIKTLVESGDTLGAQKVILGELNKEFGGSAAAQATAGDKLKVVWGNLQEQLGEKLIPIVEKVATWLSDNLPDAMESAEEWAGKLGDKIKELGKWLGDHKEVLIGVAAAIGTVLVAAFIAWAASAAAAAVATIAATWPVLAIAAAVGVLAAGIVWAYNNVDWFRSAVDALGRFLKEKVGPAFAFLWEVIKKVFNWIKDNWKLVLAFITGPLGAAVLIVVSHWDKIKGAALAVWNWLKGAFQAVKGFIAGPVSDAVRTVVGAFGSVITKAQEVYNSVKEKFQAVVDFISGIPGKILGFAESFLTAGASIGSSILDGIKNGVEAAVGFVTDIASGIWKKIKELVNTNVIDKLNSAIPDSIFGFNIDANPIPRLHSGGFVTGPPGSEQLRILQAGEYVMSRAQVANAKNMGGDNIVINLYGTSVTPEDVVRALNEERRRNGNRRLAA